MIVKVGVATPSLAKDRVQLGIVAIGADGEGERATTILGHSEFNTKQTQIFFVDRTLQISVIFSIHPKYQRLQNAMAATLTEPRSH